MPSASLVVWKTQRAAALDEIHAQCVACETLSPPKPVLLEENIRGYVLLLSAHFQGFCRDLYTECSQFIASNVGPSLEIIVQTQFSANSALNHGNPNYDNIRKDFGRFGMILDLPAAHRANPTRLNHLVALNKLRNAAAHHGELPAGGLPSTALVQVWRYSCNGLATSLDGIMYNQLRATISRQRPWIP